MSKSMWTVGEIDKFWVMEWKEKESTSKDLKRLVYGSLRGMERYCVVCGIALIGQVGVRIVCRI